MGDAYWMKNERQRQVHLSLIPLEIVKKTYLISLCLMPIRISLFKIFGRIDFEETSNKKIRTSFIKAALDSLFSYRKK